MIKTFPRREEWYADLPLGLVDAAVIVTCEVLDEDKVATLDHLHFTVVRDRLTCHVCDCFPISHDARQAIGMRGPPLR